MKIAFDGLIKLDTEERISALKEMSIETSKTEIQIEKKQNSQEQWDNYKKSNICLREEGRNRIFEVIILRLLQK